jgi:hypothetical protein
MVLIPQEMLFKPAEERVKHYQSEADRHRQLAEAEAAEKTRAQLIGLAKEYQVLANALANRLAK